MWPVRQRVIGCGILSKCFLDGLVQERSGEVLLRFLAAGLDVGVEVVAVDADVLAELDDGDAAFGAQPTDEAGGRAEAFGGLVDGAASGLLEALWVACRCCRWPRCSVDPTSPESRLLPRIRCPVAVLVRTGSSSVAACRLVSCRVRPSGLVEANRDKDVTFR